MLQEYCLELTVVWDAVSLFLGLVNAWSIVQSDYWSNQQGVKYGKTDVAPKNSSVRKDSKSTVLKLASNPREVC